MFFSENIENGFLKQKRTTSHGLGNNLTTDINRTKTTRGNLENFEHSEENENSRTKPGNNIKYLKKNAKTHKATEQFFKRIENFE